MSTEPPVKIKDLAALTDRGRKRKNNEDACLTLATVPLLAVADGVGGRDAGEVASAIAVEALTDAAEALRGQAERVSRDRSTDSRLAMGRMLDRVFRQAHERIHAEALQRGKPGMATTLVAAVVAGHHAYVAHVGDSRAYLFRNGRLRRLTDDHSVAMLWYRQGRGRLEDLERHPQGGSLYQALGVAGHLEVDTAEVALTEGDILILCSDGLYGPFGETGVVSVLRGTDELARAAAQMVAGANQNGGPDNVTVALARVGGMATAPVHTGEIANILRSVFLFRHLSEAERMLIAPYLEERSYKPGELLVQEGEPAGEFFLVLEGNVRITRGQTYLTHIGPRGHLGEMGLVPRNRRTATATADEATFCYVLSREHFEELGRIRPALGARLSMTLMEAMGDRLRDLTDRIAMISRMANGDLRLPGKPER